MSRSSFGIVVLFLSLASASLYSQASWMFGKRPMPLRNDRARMAIIFDDAKETFSDGDAERLRAVGLPVASFKLLPIPGIVLVDLIGTADDRDYSAWIDRAEFAMPGAFVTPVFFDDLGGPLFPTRHILVRFAEDPRRDPSWNDRLESLSIRADFESTFAGLDRCYRLKCEAKDGWELLTATVSLARRDDVEFAEPDFVATIEPTYFANDPDFGFSWQIHNSGQTLVALKDLDMDVAEAWDLSMGSGRITVALLDDGIQFEHPDVAASYGADATSYGPGNGAPVLTTDGHGTVVAGSIAGTIDNGRGACGICPNGRLISVKTFVSTGIGQAIVMASWIASAVSTAQTLGARITNSSFTSGIVSMTTSAVFSQTRQQGMLHFAASGNNGNTTNTITFPANSPGVRAVTGVDEAFALLWFATTGPGLAFAAPATYIQTTDLLGPDGFNTGDYVHPQGTSFGASSATSVAALVLAINPTLGAADVDDIMEKSAVDLGPVGYDTSFGYGVLNAYSAALRAALTLSDPSATAFGVRGRFADDRLGVCVLGRFDRDADGTLDLCVGAPGDDFSAIDAGRAVVISGKTGALLFDTPGTSPSAAFGAAAAAGNADGQSGADLLIGAPNDAAGGTSAGSVTMHVSSAIVPIWTRTGAPQENYGAAIQRLGDIDLDGKDDFLVGAPGAAVAGTPDTGRVELLSGALGSVLWSFSGDAARGERSIGKVLLRIPDRTGDGIPDVVLGAPESDANGQDAGTIVILSGANGQRVLTRDGFAPADLFGAALTMTNDIDFDTIAELIIGAPGSGLVAPGGGAVFALASQSGFLLPASGGKSAGDAYGAAVVAADFDGDFVLDLAVGAPGDDRALPDAGRVFVYGGTNGQTIYDLLGGRAGSRFGATLADVGDIDGDGFAEAVAGLPSAPGSSDPGLAIVFPAPRPQSRSPLEPAASGTMTTAWGALYNALLVNGSAGGFARKVEVPIGGSIAISVQQPATSTFPAPFAVYGMFGTPTPMQSTALPLGIGNLVLPPCPLAPGQPSLFTLTSNVVPDGCALMASTPTPWRSVAGQGLPFPLTVTLQGVLYDVSSGWRITNAVTLDVF